jgi:hypothetical protein
LEFVEALEQEGVRAWSAADMEPGDSLVDSVEKALRDSRVVVFLLTSDFVNSPWAAFEIGAAVGGNKKIIPIAAQDVARAQVPPLLQQLAWLEEPSPRAAGKRVAEVIGHMSEQ